VARRALIVLAGPVANLALAMALMTGLLVVGQAEWKALIGTPVPGSLMQKAGVNAGDEVLALVRAEQEVDIASYPDLRWQLARAGADRDEVTLILQTPAGQRREGRLPLQGLSADVSQADWWRELGLSGPWSAPVLSRVLSGGQADADACFVQPTLLDQAPTDARLMREEIFGPLLPVIGYESLDEVITAINADPKPLALYIYSRNRQHVEQVLSQTSSGGACVNHSLIQFLHGRLPFGGVNNSGIGHAHGHYGFKAFSHERAVVQTQLPLAATLFGAGEVPAPIRKAMRAAFKWL